MIDSIFFWKQQLDLLFECAVRIYSNVAERNKPKYPPAEDHPDHSFFEDSASASKNGNDIG